MKGSKALGAAMALWHSSMGDPIYAAGSHFYAGMPVKISVAQDALEKVKAEALAYLEGKRAQGDLLEEAA